MDESSIYGLIDYKGTLAMVVPIIIYEHGGPVPTGRFCCFVLDERLPSRGQPGSNLIVVQTKDGKVLDYDSVEDALEGAREFGDLWFRGIV